MADDTSVQIRFGASTDEALDAIKAVQNQLSGLADPVKSVGSSLEQLKKMFGDALPAGQLAQLATALANVHTSADDAAEAQSRSIDAQMRALHQGSAETKIVLDAEVKQFQLTQDQKFALLRAETEREYNEELKLLGQKALLQAETGKSTQQTLDRVALLTQKHHTDMLRLDEQSIAAQQALWNGYLSSVTGAFNSQLRGLLEGTTSWHKAMKKILEDLTIKFIEMAEQDVKKWLAGELAKTTATTSGAAARASAEQTAASSGLLVNIATAAKTILADAAQTFAGVFAFLAPAMGPAAAGPAVAAEATVARGSHAVRRRHRLRGAWRACAHPSR